MAKSTQSGWERVLVIVNGWLARSADDHVYTRMAVVGLDDG
jgi:hypothetical protein